MHDNIICIKSIILSETGQKTGFYHWIINGKFKQPLLSNLEKN